MSLRYPVLYKSQDAKSDLIVKAAVDAAIADALELWKPEQFDGVFAMKGFGIQKLKCGDLAKDSMVGPYTYMWTMSINTASAWETYINSVLSDSCYVIITGVYNYDAQPDVEAIKVIAEGVEYSPFDLNEMYGWDVAVAYFSHPIVIRPKKGIKIKVKARTIGKKNIGFIGYTLATRSYLIQEI